MKPVFIALFVCLFLNSYSQTHNAYDFKKIVFKSDSAASFNSQLPIKFGILPNIKNVPYQFELRLYPYSSSLTSGKIIRYYIKNDSLFKEAYQYVFYHKPELNGWLLAKNQPTPERFLIYKIQEQVAFILNDEQISNLVNSKVFEIPDWEQEQKILLKNGLSTANFPALTSFYSFLEIKLDTHFRNLNIVSGSEAAQVYPYFQKVNHIAKLLSNNLIDENP
ncbi:MAG: hypothetical protein AAGC65_12405 [Mucilaginibacter sp.]|uniref:hypothetical protein n=1 Tax=Mucilaginibacter sp. TaxID=1882438 RepID=UPI0031B3A160